MHRTRLLMTLAVLVVALALPSVAGAQALGINYFDNANGTLPDGTVRITTPHLRILGTGLGAGHGPDQCALIYVLKPDQEIAACCGCKLTPNALLKLSVNTDLTANTLSGILTGGTIAIVPSLPNGVILPPATVSTSCDAGRPPIATRATVGTAFVTAWATHVQDSGAITEDDFDFSTDAGALSTVTALWEDCTVNVEGNGSSSGVCTCGSGSATPW